MGLICKNFASDNESGIHSNILDALKLASIGNFSAYGADSFSRDAQKAVSELFETDCRVFFVSTGTAANGLALASLCPPYGGIYAHFEAHILNDEATAPELFTGGARQLGVHGLAAVPCVNALRKCIFASSERGVHSLVPSVIALSNLTEWGAVLAREDLEPYGELAREKGMSLLVDGARFANAVAATGQKPSELTWRAGVDVLTFGATKNGAMGVEAVIFFDLNKAGAFEHHRKRTGHLTSKHRFLSAQFLAYLAEDLWLRNAEHANSVAQRLRIGLSALPGITVLEHCLANELFVTMQQSILKFLRNEGFTFYDWPPTPNLVRLVTSFETTKDDVDYFLQRAEAAVSDH